MKVLYLFNFIILILSGSCTPKEAIIEANKKFVIDINQQDKITIFFNAYHTIALETTPNNLIGGIDKIVLQNEHIYILDKKQATIFRSMILMCIAFHEQIRKFSNMIPTVFFKILYK